eukprot:gene23107-30308_t
MWTRIPCRVQPSASRAQSASVSFRLSSPQLLRLLTCRFFFTHNRETFGGSQRPLVVADEAAAREPFSLSTLSSSSPHSSMQWQQQQRPPEGTIARFGHTAVSLLASAWGSELLLIFGGVSDQSKADGGSSEHSALRELIVLEVETRRWLSPALSSAVQPDARAFHAAAVVGSKMYIYGGHVLLFDPVFNKKRRLFFNDLWVLDTDTWVWESVKTTSAEDTWAWELVKATSAEVNGGMPCKRDMATLTSAGPGCMLLFGGRNEGGRAIADPWVLNLTK